MAPRQKVNSQEDLEKILKPMKRMEAINWLKSHHLMKTCSKDRPDGQPKPGGLVWARANGSVYWPGFIPDLKDKEESEYEADEDDDSYAIVMFLEETFRYTQVLWEYVIPVQDVTAQKLLVDKYNRLVLKMKKGPSSYSKKALELLEEFLPMDPKERTSKAEENYTKKLSGRKRASTNNVAPKKEKDAKVEEPPKQKAQEFKDKINQMVTEKKKLRKSGHRVSDRILTKQVDQLKTQSKAATAVKKTEKPEEEKPQKPSKNKNARPVIGGEVMREWTKSRFDKVPKNYTFESNSPPPCTKCELPIDGNEDSKCHGMPYHPTCLEEVDKDSNSGSGSPVRKCRMCIEQLCFLCRSPNEGQNLPLKCSRCDLRFHIDCLLKDWPQAEIQGSNGPITCPTHFCHTCLGEQKVSGKFRDYTTNPSKAYHCLLCLSTYHKCCLPAGCGEDIKGKEYIICPQHKLPDLKVIQRRIGCLLCFKHMTQKEPERVECQLCMQTFHPACIGYTDEVKAQISLEDFAKGYKCFTCRWGVFPIYGQVVWFQQPQSIYWPARILYPQEAKARSTAKRQPGQYSIEYFGETSFYDNASRAFSLHLTTVEIFRILKVYQDTPKIRAAHEEAGFFLQFAEAARDKLLPPPKPVYRKIDKNVYRTLAITKMKEPTRPIDPCSCADDKEAKFVCVPDSGCTNRDMEMECSDKICKGGSRCSNRMFVERKNNDDEFLEQKLFPNKGWGVIAKKKFEAGDFVAEYRGEVIDRKEKIWRLNKKEEEDPLYLFELSTEYFIDAEYVGNMSRLINHSCDPNCEIRKYLSLGRSVGGIFAKREIDVGEEVTFDYGCGSQSTAPFRCRCGAANCVVFVGKEVPEGFQAEEDPENNEQWDDVCAKCSFGGSLICCDFPGCEKVWHSKCVGLSRHPSKSSDWYCPHHSEKEKAQQMAQRKKSSVVVKNRRRKVRNGSLSSSKSSGSSSASSVTSESAPKRKQRLSAQSTATLVRKSVQKLSLLSNDEVPVQKGEKRKPPAEQTEDEESQPPLKKQKTTVANTKSDNISQERPLSDKNTVSTTPPTVISAKRKLRSSTGPNANTLQNEPNGVNGIVEKKLDPVDAEINASEPRITAANYNTKGKLTVVGTRS